MGVGPSEPRVGYNLLMLRFLSLSEERSIRVGVARFSSEMNPVLQMEMQKSLVFCVAHAGSCRPELFLFGHLGSSSKHFSFLPPCEEGALLPLLLLP
ncbi:hypothetical protein CK820_G0014618 [Pan troglodytes]|uniref:Uncharacterized protein n=1 Tax=Pan troglodytes TaxID=9598 RepID=A0A2J8QSR1_PANTR|nr:hypothetical protein CK820_G0014618 [Pan troglodytes]